MGFDDATRRVKSRWICSQWKSDGLDCGTRKRKEPFTKDRLAFESAAHWNEYKCACCERNIIFVARENDRRCNMTYDIFVSVRDIESRLLLFLSLVISCQHSIETLAILRQSRNPWLIDAPRAKGNLEYSKTVKLVYARL